jgi:hypothetical protein
LKAFTVCFYHKALLCGSFMIVTAAMSVKAFAVSHQVKLR